ncbi:MAG: polysaccharide pyruvyl transferase family protein, partial [Lachnospiraceae bacterium]|nr:polysaccharide pyruvyl transferase family protein [Lachnospiraceae bacterium]
LIEPIHQISVREKSLKTYINSICDKPVTHVLDPVFLHDRDFYMNIAVRPAKKGYVLIYIVMGKCRSVVEMAVQYAQERGLEVIELGEELEDAHIPNGTEHPVLYDVGVEEWLGYMADAECVFTNSFHACALSIILHKKFYAGPRSGDKIDSVLELFELENRRIYVDEENLSEKLTQDIDFDRVDEIWKEQRKISEDFLLNALNEAEEYVSEHGR